MALPEPHPAGVVRLRADQPRIETPNLTTVLTAPGSATGGEFGLFDCRIPPGALGPVPHYHEHFTESFYVLSGRLAVRTGDDRVTAGSGDLVHVPRRGIHAFHPSGDGEAHFLILFTPGAPREEYFAEMAALQDRAEPPTTAEIDEIAARHDQVNLR
jgi:mannose-6-phosphate isomerase-like protein (cupin superfamily)